MPHQLTLHNCQTKNLVAIAGRQIGKTVACTNEIIKRAIKYPATRNWYVTNDYKQAKRNVWDMFRRFVVPELQAKFNSSELSIMLPNGSKIELVGVENAQSLRGAAVHFMVLDEYADFPREIWPEVLRPMFSTTNGGTWFVGTPKGLGNDLYDKYLLSDENTSKFKFPSCTIVDGHIVQTLSKYAMRKEIQDAYNTLPRDSFNQEYMAEFTRPSGTVYANWPLDNFRRVEYNQDLPLHLTMDFGVNDPTTLIWIQPTGSETRIIDYYEARNANIAHYNSVIQGKPYRPIELYTGDDAGRARTLTTGTSPIEELGKYGIYVRTTGGLKIPDQIRITQEKIKSVFVDNSTPMMKQFRDCLLNYKYPEKKETVVNQSNEIPIHDWASHAMRALEYYFVNARGLDYNSGVVMAGDLSTKNWSFS